VHYKNPAVDMDLPGYIKGRSKMLGKYDLHHEFPEYYDRIRELKRCNRYFARLFEEYHDITSEVRRVDEGLENPTDAYLESLKKKRLLYKDRLYGMIMNG
jgi:hypothetical protein